MRRVHQLRFGLAAGVTAVLLGCSNEYREPTPQPNQPLSAGDTLAVTSANRLVTFNRAMPSIRTSALITGLQAGETIVGIDIRPGGTTPGELYALTSAGRLYTVSAAGVVTLKSTLAADPADTSSPYTGLSGTDFGVDFNPVVDRLRVVSNTGQNLRINVDTGATTTDGGLNVAGAARMGINGAAYMQSFAAACRTALYYVDATMDRLLTTTDPNNGVLTDVGALGVDATAGASIEIVTSSSATNSAFAVLMQNSVPTVFSINLSTGAATSNGALTGLNQGESVTGLAIAPPATAPAQSRGDVLALTASNKLISFTAAAPQKTCTSVTLTGLQANENALGFDVRPADGALYALGSGGRLYTVDMDTGAATLRSTLAADPADTTSPFTALAGADFGVDFNPVPDRLRVVSNSGQNLRINVDSGATTTDANLNPAGSTITAAAYTNSFAGAGSTQLYVLDVGNDRLMLQGQPSGNPNNGDLQAVGALGITGDVQAVTGFDIDGRNSTAIAALTIGAATTSELQSINLATGAATRVNAIGGGEIVRGLAFATRPVATAFGVTTDNRLVSFALTTPGTLATNAAITGLQGGENIVGTDFRPANGRLYALTDAGRVYTVDPATAAASSPIAFTADATDTTLPYTALAGTAFGVDFNPVPDRLRTVSDAEQNLRSNVDTGATTTDSALNRTAFAVTAAAYSNNFAGTATTTLYVIDTTSDRLLTQNPPNNGTLNDVGPLGVNAEAVSAFEIVGPDTALVVLATATTPAGLYSINLNTGSATLVGAIALPQPTDRLNGLTAVPSMATPAADSTVYGLINGSTLIVFARNAPGTILGSIPITGLQSGETLLGVDFRPNGGALYALGSTGRVYTIDMAGAATLAATLAADGTDTTDPFTTLNGTHFGIDFNPVPDRLRIVSDTGQNLRVNVATGATFTDGALNYVAPDVIAAAYTRSFAGTTTTSLYVVDIATGTLQLQDPPNNGVLATIGRLDPALTFASTGGFDIAGGDDGIVLAVLQTGGATQSTLYRVNLRTGAATAVGTVGPNGTPLLRGLAIRLQ